MISQTRYINIISGVGAGAAVAQRQLILRLLTQNALIPPGVVIEFANATAVGAYFGTSSEEYNRAVKYFAFISKSIGSPGAISFARWVSAAIAPTITGDMTPKTLASFTPFTAGTLTVNDGNTAYQVTGLNFSASASLTAVAATLQTALRATASPQLATCSVTYNTNTNQFNLAGTTTGTGSLTVTPTGLSTDTSAALGWGTTGTVYAPGQGVQTAVAAITSSANISNNFGSFAFCTPSAAMANADIAAVSAWNAAQNNLYIYSVATYLSNLGALYALVGGNAGTALNILSNVLANDYVEQCPSEILAATDYSKAGATQNYMYYQFANRNVTVSDDSTADTADLNRGNYIGVTQAAGQKLAFFQRGVLCGGSTAATDMNTYANEMWLKSDAAYRFLALFLSAARVPANNAGAATILAILQQTIDLAKTNGTISTGKTLSALQQQFITQQSGDVNAWRQVQSIGYWATVYFTSAATPDGRIEWTANYVLIYAKDDAVRKVSGSNVLI